MLLYNTYTCVYIVHDHMIILFYYFIFYNFHKMQAILFLFLLATTYYVLHNGKYTL